ncbi:helix-turn-helix domain-containing protein [Streptomyces sp. NPDC001941]|uniref:TetR/AcrR family transcriptional regulator n=1 Tax=Streptomyces sp. NPDC001941 TaxID=3154659 RepID=UPI00331775C9
MAGDEGLGLRERKKKQTATKVWHTALRLFLQHGYDQVSVAQIAEAAEVSKMTVFNYFKTKEDLLMNPMEAHMGDMASAVRSRGPGESVLAAVCSQFLELVEARDASVGLAGGEHQRQLIQLIAGTPVLTRRAHLWAVRSEELLAEALAEETDDELLPLLAAAQLAGVRGALIGDHHRRVANGEPVAQVAEGAAERAERAFDFLGRGLEGFAVREERPAAASH